MLKEEVKEKEVVKEVKLPKIEKIFLEAKLKGRDEDGNTILIPYTAEGETVKEVLEKIGLPKGLNQLVKVKCVWGGKQVVVSLAPHNVRRIFDDLDVELFNRKFGM